MPTVSVSRHVEVSLTAAERLWYDTGRWAEWVDGLDAVTAVEGDWPAVGACVTWRSGPAGRGTVTERVLEYASGRGQRLAVHDRSIDGEQTVEFSAREAGAQVTLRLAYRLRRRNPVTVVVDVLFIRRAMGDALAHTLERFAAALPAAPVGR